MNDTYRCSPDSCSKKVCQIRTRPKLKKLQHYASSGAVAQNYSRKNNRIIFCKLFSYSVQYA